MERVTDMNKTKILIPIIIVLIGIGIVICDEANITVEDVIFQQSAIDNTSPVEHIIGTAKSGNLGIYLYFTEDNRIGYATIKENDSLFNKYSLCTVENISEELLINKKEIYQQYNEQQLDFYYGIIVNPQSDSIVYENQSFDLEIMDCNEYKIGIFIFDNSTGI